MAEKDRQLTTGDKGELGLLARWYATPLDRDAAVSLLHVAQKREALRVRRGKSCYTCRLQRMTAHYWLGKEIDEEYQALQLQLRHTAHGRILAELIYGQLLMSQRRGGAMAALDNAFNNARHLLAPRDYFELFKRHGLLRRLPLGAATQSSFSLADLLTTAAVIERLTTPERGVRRGDDGRSI